MDPDLKWVIQMLLTLAIQVGGVRMLARKVEAKAEKSDLDDHVYDRLAHNAFPAEADQ